MFDEILSKIKNVPVMNPCPVCNNVDFVDVRIVINWFDREIDCCGVSCAACGTNSSKIIEPYDIDEYTTDEKLLENMVIEAVKSWNEEF